jgi:hypothetical protein
LSRLCLSPAVSPAKENRLTGAKVIGAWTQLGVHDEARCLKRLMSSQAQFVAAWIVIFIIAALAYWVYLQTAPMD